MDKHLFSSTNEENDNSTATMKIAHLSDPHINRTFHPTHIRTLRATLEHALKSGVDHIVITGDLTSDADERDMKDARKLFSELGILNANKLSLVIGNHDIFGGPHLAEDLIAFPGRCADRDYQHQVDRFCALFEETFYGTLRMSSNPFPYLKIVGNSALIGLNTVAERSAFTNPVGSNGALASEDLKEMSALLQLPAAALAKHRIALMHHHVFRKKDEEQFHDAYTSRIFRFFEQETLKLRGKRKLLKALKEGNVDLLLHGHVHFTAEYYRKGIRCVNGAGAIMPLLASMGNRYNLITLEDEISIEHPKVRTPREKQPAPPSQNSQKKRVKSDSAH